MLRTSKIFALLFVLALFAVGCDRGSGDTTTDPPVATSAEPVVPEEAPAEAAPKPTEDRAGEVGASCKVDRDCVSYHRCYDETCTVPPAITGEKTEETPKAIFYKDGEKRAEFWLELASTPAERARGLMFRREMREDWGMLFIYPGDGPRSFWMKDTLIPLDMIFISSEGEVVGIVTGAEPLTKTPRRVDEPSRYVLEVKAGVAEKAGVVPGATMKLENVPESAKTAP